MKVFSPSDKQKHTSVEVNCKVRELSCTCSVGPMESEAVFAPKVTSQWFCDAASDAALLCVEDELNSCQELNDLEPGNKCERFS